MANTSVVYARIDAGLKENAEGILSTLGISPANAIQMLYSQIVLQRGMPFELRLPDVMPAAIGSMSRADLDLEINRGVKSLHTGKGISADEVDAVLKQEFGI